jgi:hypothetical protein
VRHEVASRRWFPRDGGNHLCLQVRRDGAARYARRAGAITAPVAGAHGAILTAPSGAHASIMSTQAATPAG